MYNRKCPTIVIRNHRPKIEPIKYKTLYLPNYFFIVFSFFFFFTQKEQVVNDIEEGRVLVEMEPVLYELTITKLTTAREKVISRTVLKLGEVTLRNDLHSPMKVESVITFQWRYNSSWGTVKAMLRGLNTTIFLPDTSQDEKVKWGIQKEEIRDGIQR